MTNWPTKKLGEICEIISPGIKKFEGSKKYIATADVNFDEIINFTEVTYNNRPGRANVEVKENDVLVARMAETKKFLIVDKKFQDNYIFSTGFVALRTKKELFPKSLFYFLTTKNFNIQKNKLAVGATQKAINNPALKKIKIPLPPLNIQKQIVERLDKIVETQKLNDGLIQKADELFQSFLHKELSPAGKDWEMKKIKNVAVVKNGGTPDTKNSKYWNGKVLWLTPKELSGIEDMEVFNTERKISDEGLKHSSATFLPTGTVLLTSRAPIGYIAIAGVPMATNQGFKNFICNKKLLDNKFLYFFLRLKTKYLQSLGRGATFIEISKTTVEKLDIPIPPLETQKQIVAKLSAVQDYKTQLLNQKNKLKELFDSVLHKSMQNDSVLSR